MINTNGPMNEPTTEQSTVDVLENAPDWVRAYAAQSKVHAAGDRIYSRIVGGIFLCGALALVGAVVFRVLGG